MRICNILSLARESLWSIVVVLSSFVPLSCTGQDESDRQNVSKPNAQRQEVYREGESGYECYRIPAIVTLQDGTLLAFAEARRLRSNGDSGEIDLVVKRSSDEGMTWSSAITVWEDARNTCGNPAPIVTSSGKVHLLMTWNNGQDKWSSISSGSSHDTRRIFHTYSEDGGISWSTPKELTEKVKGVDWKWYGTGPCHGIETRSGRIIVPCYYSVVENGKTESYSHVIYSDDDGNTWQSGAAVSGRGHGECSVAELKDGSLLLNMRTSGTDRRSSARSSDGGETWSQPIVEQIQVDSDCQGSILADGNTVFLSNAASVSERINMTIRRSDDAGKNWNSGLSIWGGPSGYSDMTFTRSGKIVLFYEKGNKRYTESLAVQIVDPRLLEER